APEPPLSVNFLRQMLPVDTGFAEVGGWVYENNPASAALAREGSFWWSPSLLVGDAERLALKYVVASAPHTRRAFQDDARWSKVVDTPTFALYEAKDTTPRLATCGARETSGFVEQYLDGGGYRYAWRVARGAGETGACVLRVNASDAWTIHADGT